MTQDKNIEGLRNSLLLETLDDAQIEEIAQSCQWMSYRGNHLIISQSDPSTDVFFVIEGTVRAKSFSQSGKEVSFKDISAGDLFGEFSAIDGLVRSTSIFSVTPCTLAILSAEDFRGILGTIPGIALRLLDMLVEKTRSLNDRVFEFSTLPVKDRVNIALLRLSEDVENDGKTAIIQHAPTHQELAARISTHREAVTRELNLLAAKNLIKLSRGRIEIMNLPQLEILVENASQE